MRQEPRGAGMAELNRVVSVRGAELMKKTTAKNEKKTLTVNQKREIRECFEMMDDGDGLMNPVEFYKAMHALGLVPKEGEAETLFAKTDLDGSGEIDLEEFSALMSNHILEKESKEYTQLLKLLNSIEKEDKRSQLEQLQATAERMGEEIDVEELKALLATGVDGEGALMPGFKLDTFFDILFSSTEPHALRTWYPGQRIEQQKAEEKAEKRRQLLAEQESQQSILSKDKSKSKNTR